MIAAYAFHEESSTTTPWAARKVAALSTVAERPWPKPDAMPSSAARPAGGDRRPTAASATNSPPLAASVRTQANPETSLTSPPLGRPSRSSAERAALITTIATAVCRSTVVRKMSAESSSVKGSSTTRIGSTNEIAPPCRASACNTTPRIIAAIPASHTGRRSKSTISPSRSRSVRGALIAPRRCRTDPSAYAAAASTVSRSSITPAVRALDHQDPSGVTLTYAGEAAHDGRREVGAGRHHDGDPDELGTLQSQC